MTQITRVVAHIVAFNMCTYSVWNIMKYFIKIITSNKSAANSYFTQEFRGQTAHRVSEKKLHTRTSNAKVSPVAEGCPIKGGYKRGVVMCE